ncbi:MAG: hypothetical protein QOK15_3971, partial [Nocardioidaceae bacterium]|nr:hypothetical protein [Nocardioidaceae bacterium]
MSESTNTENSTSTPTGAATGAPTSAATSAAKDPSDWVTGDEPATGPQRSYLETLAQDSGAEIPEQLS